LRPTISGASYSLWFVANRVHELDAGIGSDGNQRAMEPDIAKDMIVKLSH